MIDLNQIDELLKKVNSLQERITECKDDRQAIALQSELVDLLQETFKNEELLATMMLLGQKMGH